MQIVTCFIFGISQLLRKSFWIISIALIISDKSVIPCPKNITFDKAEVLKVVIFPFKGQFRIAHSFRTFFDNCYSSQKELYALLIFYCTNKRHPKFLLNRLLSQHILFLGLLRLSFCEPFQTSESRNSEFY